MSPRKPENPKVYNRKKARKWSDEAPMTMPFDLDYLSLYVSVEWGTIDSCHLERKGHEQKLLIRHRRFDLCAESRCR